MALRRELPVPGVPMVLSGWSFTLTDLVPWSHRQLMLFSGLMALFDATLLGLLYRDWRLWLIQVATLAMAVAANLILAPTFGVAGAASAGALAAFFRSAALILLTRFALASAHLTS